MGQVLCVPRRKRKVDAASSFHHTNVVEVQSPTDFQCLPGDTKMHILSLLPVADVARSRNVCTEWRDILSSSSRLKSFPSSSSHCHSGFWDSFWIKNRPMERWVFLHHGHLAYTWLYDVHRRVCYHYPACPKPPKSTQFVPSYQLLANTTANGLVLFLEEISISDQPLVARIWTYNPLTGRQTLIPDVEIPWQSKTWMTFAVEDVSSRTGPNYKVMLIGQTPRVSADQPQNLPQQEIDVLLYSSGEKRWEKHESVGARRGWCYLELNKFYENGSICILEIDTGSASSSVRLYNLYRTFTEQIAPFRAEADCHVKWFDLKNYRWNTCPIYPPEELVPIFKLKQFYLFDRNRELVLLASLLCPREFAIDFRVYKSTSTIVRGTPPSWTFLSAIPDTVAESAGCRPFSRNQSWRRARNLSKFQVFPLPDKIQGDKLMIILFQNETFSVISFNLESSPAEAWSTVIATPDFLVPFHQQTRNYTPSEEKIGQWTGQISEVVRDNLLFRIPYQSGSLRGFTFEPRLDDF